MTVPNYKKTVGVGLVGIVAIGLALVPAASASAADGWNGYGYNNCSSPQRPTTMSSSIGYTWHQINDGGVLRYAEDYGSGARKFHSLGTGGSTYASSAGIEVYSATTLLWTCGGSGYDYTGW